jgi:hypothetical protein
VYARELDGRTLSFGVSGKLVRNSLVMYDRETRSLWSHLTGEALSGPLQGKRLTQVPSSQTTWGLWLKQHPNTLLLHADQYDLRDPYDPYYAGADIGIMGGKHSDNRLPPKERVIGLRIGSQVKAYSFKALGRDRVVNDGLGGVPLVIVFDPQSESGAVYRRDPGGSVIRFEPGKAALQMIDPETGSTWDGLAGKASAGPMLETELKAIPITYSFWFGWADFYPETEVYK